MAELHIAPQIKTATGYDSMKFLSYQADNGFSTYTHTRTGTVNELVSSQGGNNIKFVATAANVVGDTWKVNGVTVTAADEGGNALSAGSIGVGQTIRCVLNGTALTFSGGGAAVGTGVEMKLLWTNPQPTQPFSAKTVSVNFQGYTDVFIKFSSGGYMVSGFCAVGENSLASTFSQQMLRRLFTTTNNSVAFTSGQIVITYGGATSNDDTVLIPFEIYGVKGIVK